MRDGFRVSEECLNGSSAISARIPLGELKNRPGNKTSRNKVETFETTIKLAFRSSISLMHGIRVKGNSCEQLETDRNTARM